jgi:hypothetical protein
MIHWTYLELSDPPWEGYGDLPNRLPDNKEEAMGFGEDLLQFRQTEKKITIDVGWYPEADYQGHFKCQVIENENWEKPLNFVDIYDPAAVWSWLQESITKYS